MILIIPAIRIKNGKCVYKPLNWKGTESSDDPVNVAKLWRTENAKSLHVTDIDGTEKGYIVNINTIETMIKTVDIPFEIGGGIRSFSEAQKAFNIGAYRILIGTLFLEKPDEAVRILDAFGASKVVIGLTVENGIVQTKGWKFDAQSTPIDAVLRAKNMGFKRIVYRDITTDGRESKMNFNAVRLLAEQTGMRVTASGGIENLADLMKIQELSGIGVDSVVIGKALYENKFSCQKIWRICECGNYPYTAKI